MHEGLKKLWSAFRDWVEGNEDRHEDEVLLPELPPELPFTRTTVPRVLRHHEETVRERYDAWLELHGRVEIGRASCRERV